MYLWGIPTGTMRIGFADWVFSLHMNNSTLSETPFHFVINQHTLSPTERYGQHGFEKI